MRTRAPVAARAAIALLVFATLAARPTLDAQAPTRGVRDEGTAQRGAAADEQAIRALSQQWLEAQRRQDVAAVMANYAEDAAAVYGARLLTGRDAIRTNLEDEFAKLPRERPGFVPAWTTSAVVVSQARDMAYESGTYEDSWNGGQGRERGHYLTVWRKVGGQWKVARDITTPEPAPSDVGAPGATAAGAARGWTAETRIVSLRPATLKGGVRAEEFERFFADSVAGPIARHVPGARGYLLEGERGARVGEYVIVWEFDSRARRDEYFPKPDVSSPRWLELAKALPPNALENLSRYVEIGDYTDYVIAR
jgi:uncharacterized protein (TIGR02246 family)